MRIVIPEPYAARLARVRDGLEQHHIEWVLVPASTDFRWLTGAKARSTERLVVLGIPRRGDPFCLAPRLEAASLAIDCPWIALEPWDESDDPLARLSGRIGLERRPSLFVGEGWRTSPLLTLASSTKCTPAAALLAPLRAIKDAEEVRAMEIAGAHADEIVEAVAAAMRPGMTEHQVARMALERFEAVGATDPWPHRVPTPRCPIITPAIACSPRATS